MKIRWLFGMAFLSGCSSTAVGNPPKAGALDVVGYTAAQSVGTPVVERAFMLVDTVTFYPTCQGGDPRRLTGPFVSELTGRGLGAKPEVLLADRPLCRIEVRLKRSQASSNEIFAELGNHSLVATGKRADGRPFRLEADFEDTLVLEATAAFAVAPRRTVYVAFDLGTWISSQELDAVQGSGEIVIRPEVNPALYESVRRAMTRSAKLYEDANGNGSLDADERSPSRALASGTDSTLGRNDAGVDGAMGSKDAAPHEDAREHHRDAVEPHEDGPREHEDGAAHHEDGGEMHRDGGGDSDRLDGGEMHRDGGGDGDRLDGGEMHRDGGGLDGEGRDGRAPDEPDGSHDSDAKARDGGV